MRRALLRANCLGDACYVKFLSYNPGHDGAVAFLEDTRLIFSVEAEKDSNYRYSAITVAEVLDALGQLNAVPDVICMSGWWALDHHEFLHGSHRNGGYRGVSAEGAIMDKGRLLGGRADYFSSTHERAHILCAFGMSAVPKGTPSYALIWEGEMGSFYEIDPDLNITLIADVLSQPGNRYGLLYGLADPTFPKDGPYPRSSDAGKLMALASFSTRSKPTEEEADLLRFLLGGPYRKLSDYDQLDRAPHLNVGLEDPEFRNFAGIYSDAIFDRFHQFAHHNLEPGRPLVIAGGCGLNCDWNTRWKETGLFSDVFVPPVANDSGAAIGTAIDAQFRHTGDPKIAWDVYSGLEFRTQGAIDADAYDLFEDGEVSVADLLAQDLILGWAHGKYEIGPRALGNRSILAAPFKDETRIRLNEIKQREQFRPIAPVCLSEDAETCFGCGHESPHMLYTYRARTSDLRAVTHVNGTARLQTVTSRSNRKLHDLLTAFKAITGYGVLCNTSLNFKGKGFINNLTDLDVYVAEHGLDGFVVEGRAYLRKDSERYKTYRSRARSRVPAGIPA
ncbi:MAG: carbamoyltransferase C-terminal domain-containing protein [Pseudomonadota bacterium]|uniref:carbamoyltransferase C-terminal domain-containing protein n=1 Tax=Phenylobacterium sp. TaxID=1871053 RepID=UPI0025DF5126|nr:carbamoyltransferase C-terminal domain-containing protein [Phenylobacterium sp.]MBT9471108.1 proline dehydrogenase [Phenylobacterium sp.]